MAEEIRNEGTVNQEEQAKTTPDGNKVVTEKKHPVKDFFARNKNKIKVGLGVVGAVGVGIAADRLGIKLGSKKKSGEEAPAETTE